MHNSHSIDLQPRLSNITIVLLIGITLTIVQRVMIVEIKEPKTKNILEGSSDPPLLCSGGWRRLGFSLSLGPFTKVACIDMVELLAVHTTAHMSACACMERRLLLWCA